MHGNMTNVEKQLNKDDLLAWKHYDNTQYSLIPGISNKKAHLDRTKFGINPQYQSSINLAGSNSNIAKSKYFEKQDRMKMYGFSRDPRDAVNYNGTNKAALNNLSLLENNNAVN